MSDLPRYQKGSIGPIPFSTINEMMERLDAVMPLIEDAKIKETSTAIKPKDLMVVFAFKQSGQTNKFDWKELIIHDDQVVFEWDPGYAELAATQNLRSGSAVDENGRPLETYALCLDSSFTSGFAICIPFRQAEDQKRYLLFPILGDVTEQEPRVRFLAQVMSVENVTPEIDIADEGSEPDGLIHTRKYKCKLLEGASISGGQGDFSWGFIRKDGMIDVIDLGYHNVNRPTVDPGVTLTEVPLQVGTIIGVDRWIRETTGNAFWFYTGLPRFDVECQ